MRLLGLLFAVVWLADQGLAQPVARRGGALQRVVAVFAAGMLAAGVAVAGDDAAVEAAWKKVRRRPPAHQASSFYLVFDAFDGRWRVVHVEFVGMSRDDEPLFVGPRLYVPGAFRAGAERKFIMQQVHSSLVSHRGVVAKDVEVEEITYFEHPKRNRYDQTLLTVRGVDLSDYEPIVLAAYPPSGTPLELLSYDITRDNLLHFLAYPLRRRDCRAVEFMAKDMTVKHNCAFVSESLELVGPPIFTKETGELVALHFVLNDKGVGYGMVMLPELQHYLRQELAVSSQGKTATSWGKVKTGGGEH